LSNQSFWFSSGYSFSGFTEKWPFIQYYRLLFRYSALLFIVGHKLVFCCF